jgi:signal transduction histidine kinase
VAETDGELGQLAAVLNRTFDKLEKSFDQQVRFTADASHELRTPLSVVLTQIQLALARDRSPAEYQQTLQTCERAAERMRALVNSLLELSRVDSGEFELMLESCDLSRVARESLEFIQPLALQRKVRLEQRLEPIQIRADAMKLGQVFINLLTNAIQHNAEGISVCLSVFEKNGRAIISVCDSGAGLPAEAKEHLFERFFQLDKSRAHKGGSGLGLAISKAIVEAHGGNIRAESEPGGGTEFIIELPM